MLGRVTFIFLSIFFISACLSSCGGAKPPSEFVEVATQGTYSIRLNQEADLAFVGSLHHGGSFWSLSPLERHFDWNHKADGYSNLSSAAFSFDSKYVATTDNHTIVLWDVSTGQSVWYWNAPGEIQDIELVPKGDLALLAMSDYTATLFDIRNGGIKQRLAHDGLVYDVSVTEDGLVAASASDDLSAIVWNLNDGSKMKTFSHKNQVKKSQISPSGKLLFTSALGEPGKIWNLNSGELLFEIPSSRGHFSAARFGSNEKELLVGHTNGKIQLWSLAEGAEKAQWKATSGDKWVGNAVPIEDVAYGKTAYLAAAANGRIFYLSL